jgi:two-component system response regulator RegX3
MARKASSSSKNRSAGQRLRAGTLTLDLAGRRVIKKGVSSHLTIKECALLEILLRNNGEVLTRKRLMKEVWDTDYMGDTRTLDVHICTLRRKVEDRPHEPTLIRTVKGVGYRFEATRGKAKRST